MPFDSPDVNFGTLLTDIDQGRVQLPDFQREWKWGDPQIVTLLASLARRDTHLARRGDPAQVPGVTCKRRDILRLKLDEYLVDPRTLRSADFERFFDARRASLLELVSSAMGKPVSGHDLPGDSVTAYEVMA